jgi:hypothetical protein
VLTAAVKLDSLNCCAKFMCHWDGNDMGVQAAILNCVHSGVSEMEHRALASRSASSPTSQPTSIRNMLCTSLVDINTLPQPDEPVHVQGSIRFM